MNFIQSLYIHIGTNTYSYNVTIMGGKASTIPTFFTNILSNISHNLTITHVNLPYFFSGLTGNIDKINPLLSNFYLDNMLNKAKYTSYIPKFESKNNFYDYEFICNFFSTDNYLIYIIMFLLNNKLCQIISLCTVVFLMQKVSGTLSNDVKLVSCFTRIINVIIKFNITNYIKSFNSNHYIAHSWFDDLYSYITNKTCWLYAYINRLIYTIIFTNIILKIYNNIKNLISGFYMSYKLNLNKFVFFKTKTPLYLGYLPNVISFNSANLNFIYASLTIVYLLLGWILDYLSFIWLYMETNMNLRCIKTIAYWSKHFLYGITYILWLFMGVISTNGVYFSILEIITSLTNINIIMAILGSVITYISSGLWYFYGRAVIPEPFNLIRSVIDNISRSLENINYRNSTYRILRNIWTPINYWVFAPNSFNYYSSFRRSVLEWFSFLGMVLSTYGTWNLYTIHLLSSLSIVQHIIIWSVPTLFSGYSLIHLEVTRPRLGYLYYGLVYLSFWTSICFFTNSILVGYISINNAAAILPYILPINLVIAFIYPLPLYRGNSGSGFRHILIHLLLFVILTSVTLISAGTIWSIIGPM